jgi:hypothetical protein
MLIRENPFNFSGFVLFCKKNENKTDAKKVVREKVSLKLT